MIIPLICIAVISIAASIALVRLADSKYKPYKDDFLF